MQAKIRRSLVILNVFLLVALLFPANGSILNVRYSLASPTSTQVPKVILQQGTAGTSTIYMNQTNAKVSVKAPNSTAFISYRSNTGSNLLASPKRRTLNGTSWSSEYELSSSGSSIQYVRVAYCPIQSRGDEKIAVTLSNDGYLDAYVWNGSSWLMTNNIGYVGTVVNVYRAYDVVYERSSGKAMLVYAIYSSDTTKDLAYKIWDGNQWSAEAYIDDPSTSDIQYYWVKLASYPLTTGRVNEIALIASEETTDDANGWIWNGASWGSFLELEGTVASRTEECVFVEYEQQSGDAMFIWGYFSTNGYMESRKWAGSWGSELPQVDLTKNVNPRWFTLKADPSSNRLMATCVSDHKGITAQLYTIRWDGSSWTLDTSHDTAVDTYSQRGADFAWEPTGSKGLLVWGTTSDYIDYKTFTAPSTWSAQANITAAGTHPWIQLRRNPMSVYGGGIKILGGMLNSNLDLGALKWDGATLTNLGDAKFTADTTVSTYECFDIQFRKAIQSYDYVLKFTNQVADAWKVNLKVYNSFNIGRLLNMTIDFHDGTTSDQIVVSRGVITQSEGPQYDLPGSAIRYISIVNLNAGTSGTSYLYVYLKILVPSTSTYSLFITTFEIT